MEHTVALNANERVTHDVRRLRMDRPQGYTFEPGQAAEVALQIDGMEDEGRPFTFTSQPEDDHLELTIKAYEKRDGVTAEIPGLEEGDTVTITEAFGAIEDRGPGVFIAGGAGITPFLAILRRRAQQDDLDGCVLLFSNKTEADIICRDELESLDGLETHFTVTQAPDSPLANGRIDADFIRARVADPSATRFYLCGPPAMMDDVGSVLSELGADPESVVLED